MKHIKRLLPAAAALLTLLCIASCGAASDSQQESASAPALTSAEPEETAAPEVSEESTEPEESMKAEESAAPVFDPESLPAITLTSEDLHDGVWDADITNTSNGSNRSPQLSWEPVAGASCYAVYMVDTTANYWLHWKSLNISETSLAAGAASGTEYVGPYPPSGTHEYEIRVYALKEATEEDQSRFDSGNSKFEQIIAGLDQNSSGAGNVLAYGTLSGTYTRES